MLCNHGVLCNHGCFVLRRLACLKYLVLANMLMKSGINPFDSQEVRTLLTLCVSMTGVVLLIEVQPAVWCTL